MAGETEPTPSGPEPPEEEPSGFGDLWQLYFPGCPDVKSDKCVTITLTLCEIMQRRWADLTVGAFGEMRGRSWW
ncbi:MAG: hypothetical protein MHM6MM_006795, partial [Cercozoa sp. M6MM]